MKDNLGGSEVFVAYHLSILSLRSSGRRVCASLEAKLDVKEAENRNLHASLKRQKMAMESNNLLTNFQALESELSDSKLFVLCC